MTTQTLNPLRTPAGEPIPVPEPFLEGVERAADVLDRDLAELDSVLELTREWNFGGGVPGRYDWVELVMTVEAADARVTTRLHPADLKDDSAFRRATFTPFAGFYRKLSRYASGRVDDAVSGLRRDLEAYFAAPEN